MWRIKCVVISKNTYGEYVCKAHNQMSVRMYESDYYTEDKDDAYNTAKAMLEMHRYDNEVIEQVKNTLFITLKDNK